MFQRKEIGNQRGHNQMPNIRFKLTIQSTGCFAKHDKAFYKKLFLFKTSIPTWH